MSDLKSIIVPYKDSLRKIDYVIVGTDSVDGSSGEYTRFYEGTETITYKRWVFFGEVITQIVPKHIFNLEINIESPNYTKDYVLGRITKQLELLGRKEEIAKGEII